MPSRTQTLVGRSLVLLVAFILLLDGGLQLASAPAIVEALTHAGFSPQMAPRIALVTLACSVLLAVPATAPFGAIMTMGFLGGAICSHVRIGEFGSPPQLICVALGTLAWTGLILADQRVRGLLTSRHPLTRGPMGKRSVPADSLGPHPSVYRGFIN
jgi:hypothetical protein